jgi:hypothetical protein
LKDVLTLASSHALEWTNALPSIDTFIGGFGMEYELTSKDNLWIDSGGGNKIYFSEGGQ